MIPGNAPPLVHAEVDGSVARLTMANPPVNALSEECLRQLASALTTVTADSSVRAVILRSTGTRAFAAGADITELEHMLASAERARAHVELTSAVFATIASCPRPVIAAVHANAVGGGFELALACDFLLLDQDARVGLPEVTLGLIPGAGGTQRVTDAVGPLRAKDLLMTGRLLPAAEAHALGLVTEVCPSGQVPERAEALARRLARSAPASLAALKRLTGLGGPRPDGLAAERAEFLAVLGTADAQEGRVAFLAKRPPVFGGPTPEGDQ